MKPQRCFVDRTYCRALNNACKDSLCLTPKELSLALSVLSVSHCSAWFSPEGQFYEPAHHTSPCFIKLRSFPDRFLFHCLVNQWSKWQRLSIISCCIQPEVDQKWVSISPGDIGLKRESICYCVDRIVGSHFLVWTELGLQSLESRLF